MTRKHAGCLALLAVLVGCARTPDRETPPKAMEAAPAAADGVQESKGGGAVVTLAQESQRQAGLTAERIEARAVPLTLRFPGELAVNENRTWRVGAIAEGRVVRTYFNAGDTVAEGAVLARLHSHVVHEGRADHQQAVTELARARAAQAHLERQRDRARRLYELKAGSLQQLEAAEAELRGARAAVDHAAQEVRRAEVHLADFLRVPVEEPKHHEGGQHEGDEDLIPIFAPAAGVLLERKVNAGSVAAAGQELFVLTDVSTIWMMASVHQDNLRRLRPGINVRVFVQGFDSPFQGRVTQLANIVDPETRTLPARIEIRNPAGILRPKMFGEAEVSLPGSTTGLFVPDGAIQQLRDATVVFVQTGPETFEAVPVETGQSVAGRVEVVKGLTAGQRVVAGGSFVLKSQLMRASLAEE